VRDLFVKIKLLWCNIMSGYKQYYIYILTNWNNKVMYIGITNDINRRIYEHKNKIIKGFTGKYNLNKLVYYEIRNDIKASIEKEKELKNWRREKKNKLIEKFNPTWKDLFEPGIVIH
jgi:putative endonuclease